MDRKAIRPQTPNSMHDQAKMNRLDLENWPRREHFEFFRKFEEPFFGLVSQIDCTKAYPAAKEQGVSFFVYYMHKVAAAVNAVPEFRCRIQGDGIVVWDRVDVSATIPRADHTFGFSLMPYHPDLATFAESARIETERIQNTKGLFTRSFETDNLIHFSALPWVDFTSLSHARSFAHPDSCPKISVGKMTGTGENRTMPVAVHVHHGLVDGYHVGQFLELLQHQMDTGM